MFKELMTLDELKSEKVKLSKSQFSDEMCFDISVSGDRLEALCNEKIFKSTISYQLNYFGGFVASLKYAELVNPYELVFEILKPEDFKVRLFGGCKEGAKAKVQWQLVDFKRDVIKKWNKYIATEISDADVLSDIGSDTGVYENMKIESYSVDGWGTTVVADMGTAANIVATPNASAVKVDGEKLTVFFKEDYASLVLSDGTILTFVLKISGTGIKGEKPELYKGIFAGGKYYLAKA